MDFVVHWLWYLLAFVAGSSIAWLLTVVSIRRTDREAAVAALPGSRELGAH